MAPATVNILFVTNPLKPEITLPLFKVNVPAVVVKVPLPLNVPLRVILLGMVGAAPSGREQLLLTVLRPVCPVNVTRLKVALLQLKAAVVTSKVKVPPLALNIGTPEMVKAPATLVVPEEAVKVPAESV